MHYLKNIETFHQSFKEICDASRNILISSVKSDEDGIASVLALRLLLRDVYPEKNIKSVICSYRNKRWMHLHGFSDLEFISSLAPYFEKFDCVIFVDGNQYERFGLTKEQFRLSAAKKICIDHHDNIPDSFDLALFVPQATSAAELIYHAFASRLPRIHPYLAELLLVGILGDTGGLKYTNTDTAPILSIVERLVMEQNVDIPSLLAQWRKYDEREFRLIQEFIKNTRIISVPGWPPCVMSFVSQAIVSHNKYTNLELGETSSYYISNFSSLLNEARWGIVFYSQQSGKIRFKLRAEPRGVDVERVAAALDPSLGGGHDCAAGGYLASSAIPDLTRADDFLKNWLTSHSYDRVLNEVKTRD